MADSIPTATAMRLLNDIFVNNPTYEPYSEVEIDAASDGITDVDDESWAATPLIPLGCTAWRCPGKAPHEAHIWPSAGPGSRAWCPGVTE